MPGFGDMSGRGGSSRQARIQAPGLGFESPAALNSAIDEMNGQAHRRPHPHAQHGYQDSYQDPRYRQV